MTAMGALSPLRGPSLVIRVYPPGRSAKVGAISVNSACTTDLSRMVLRTSRRLCRLCTLPSSAFLALVISFSATGRSTRALASVVVILPCSNSAVARFETISRWWAGLPPRRAPFLGVGIASLSFLLGRTRYRGRSIDGERGGSVLLVLHKRVVVVVAVRRQGGRRVEAGRAVLEGQAHLDQLRLDLVDRLRTEVADVEQVLLRARDQLTHGVDALTLEAVVGANRQVQVLDREGEVLRQLLVDRRRADVDALGLDVQLAGQAEQLDQRLARRGDGVTRADRRLGLDVDDQLVEVGALLDSGGLDLVGHLEHRAVDRVDREPADLVVRALVLHRADVATAPLDDELHLDLALVVQGGDLQVGVVHLDARGRLDVSRGHDSGARLAQHHGDRLVVLAGDDEALEVEDDLGD